MEVISSLYFKSGLCALGIMLALTVPYTEKGDFRLNLTYILKMVVKVSNKSQSFLYGGVEGFPYKF